MKNINPDPLNEVYAEPPQFSQTIREFLAKILRGRWILIGCLGVVLFCVILYTLFATPVYESTALVLINSKESAGSLSITERSGAQSEMKLANELAILRSRMVAEGVARRIEQNPFLDSAGTVVTPIARGKSPEQGLAPAEQIAIRARRSMEFNPERESDVIRIIAKSADAREAALLANTYAEVFQEHDLSASKTRSKSLREFLGDQVRSKKRALDSTENKLRSYMQTSGMVSLEGQAGRVTQQLSQLEASRDAIDIDLQSLSKTLLSYQERLPEQEKMAARVIKQANDPYIKLIQEQLANLQVQRDVLMNQNLSAMGKEIYTQRLREIESQIANLQKKLDDRTANFLQISPTGEVGGTQADAGAYVGQARAKIFETQMQIQALQSKKTALNAVIRQYESEFGQIPRKSIDFARLQRERMSAEKLYLLVEQKFNEVSIIEKSEFGLVSIIDAAFVPGSPSSPSWSLNLLLALIIGLALGVAVVIIRESMDARINTPDDVKKRGYLLLSFVSKILGAGSNGTPTDPVGAHEGNAIHTRLVVLTQPFSPLAEAYRRLRTNLNALPFPAGSRTLLCTSPNPGEGKSTTIANLALAIAQEGKRVLLVDADLRRPTIHSIFGYELNPGFTDVVSGTASMKQALHTHFLPGLDILCAGHLSAKDTELLGSKSMLKFLEDIRHTYEWVLFDTPPVLPATDAVSLSVLVDGTLLVVSAGATRIATLEQTVEYLHGGGGRVVGVFLNNFDPREAYGHYYGSEKYGYYATSYGALAEK